MTVRFQLFTETSLKMAVFPDSVPGSQIVTYVLDELHLLKIEGVMPSETSVSVD
jgi:hypothetical protein